MCIECLENECPTCPIGVCIHKEMEQEELRGNHWPEQVWADLEEKYE